jgi:hypothetical protein
MVRVGSRKWTSAQTAHLMALIDAGASAASIAVSLERSVTIIGGQGAQSRQAFSHIVAPAFMIFYC